MPFSADSDLKHIFPTKKKCNALLISVGSKRRSQVAGHRSLEWMSIKSQDVAGNTNRRTCKYYRLRKINTLQAKLDPSVCCLFYVAVSISVKRTINAGDEFVRLPTCLKQNAE